MVVLGFKQTRTRATSDLVQEPAHQPGKCLRLFHRADMRGLRNHRQTRSGNAVHQRPRHRQGRALIQLAGNDQCGGLDGAQAGGGIDRAHGMAAADVAWRIGADQTLAEAREAVRRRLSPGLWQVVSSGRMAFGKLSREFLHGDTVARRLEAMLATRPAELQVIRYRTRSGDRASVVGKGARHYAGVEVGADGRVLRSFASR